MTGILPPVPDTSTAIRAVIFDIGGVLTTSPVQSIRAFEEQSGLPERALGPLLADHDGAWSLFEKSEISPAEFVAAFEEETVGRGLDVDGWKFLEAFYTALVVRDEMVHAVRAIRERMKVAAITNNITREERSAENPLALDDLFDVVIESSKVGVRKPDPRIYLMACEEMGVAPGECVFLDDFGVNLKAARQLGMTTIKVDETTTALDELEATLGFSLRQREP
jgi:putative hydrolase of the HAD superfamily